MAHEKRCAARLYDGALCTCDLPTNLQAGNPGLSDTAAQYGLRRAREIYERHRDPPHGLKLAEVQLAAIIAGAYEDGVAAGCKERDDVGDGEYTLIPDPAHEKNCPVMRNYWACCTCRFPKTDSQVTPSRIVPARLAPHVEGLLPEGGEE